MPRGSEPHQNLLLAVVAQAIIDAQRNNKYARSARAFLESNWYASILEWLDVSPVWLASQVENRKLPRQRYFHVLTSMSNDNEPDNVGWPWT